MAIKSELFIEQVEGKPLRCWRERPLALTCLNQVRWFDWNFDRNATKFEIQMPSLHGKVNEQNSTQPLQTR